MTERKKTAQIIESARKTVRHELSGEGFTALESWIRNTVQDSPFGCIITRDNQIVGEWYGGDFNTESLFEIGSIRKSFNSALIGNGIKMGKVRLTVRAGEIWPEISEISGDPADADITLHQLVSGISGWLTSAAPGEEFRYNNAGFTAAERIVARSFELEGDRIAPEVERRFKAALGANSWKVYHFQNRFDPADIDNPGPKLAIDSTLADLVKWGNLWLNRGVWNDTALIPAEYVDRATRPTNPQIQSTRYGYNWMLNIDRALWPRAPEDSYGHVGLGTFKPSGKESRTFMWICPSLLSVAAMVTDDKVGFADDFLDVPMGLTAEWIAGVIAEVRNLGAREGSDDYR